MRVLFLDVDGVLNSHTRAFMDGGLHVDKLLLLDDIISRSRCKIVLSSAWRYMGSGDQSVFIQCVYGALREYSYAPKQIANAVIGHTGSEPNGPEDRDVTICRWMAVNGVPDRWCAIDDLECILRLAPNAIQTASGIGMTEADAIAATNILEGGQRWSANN